MRRFIRVLIVLFVLPSTCLAEFGVPSLIPLGGPIPYCTMNMVSWKQSKHWYYYRWGVREFIVVHTFYNQTTVIDKTFDDTRWMRGPRRPPFTEKDFLR